VQQLLRIHPQVQQQQQQQQEQQQRQVVEEAQWEVLTF
jgi:hypothetical protein